jgi:hypothetical protein
MTNRKTLKETITSAVVLQLPNTYSDFNGIPVDKLLFKWWFRLAEIEFYTFDFHRRTDMSDHAYMLELTKKIKCPYYLGVNKSEDKKKIPYIKLYDSKIAMLISLYGTLVEYLDSIKVKS